MRREGAEPKQISYVNHLDGSVPPTFRLRRLYSQTTTGSALDHLSVLKGEDTQCSRVWLLQCSSPCTVGTWSSNHHLCCTVPGHISFLEAVLSNGTMPAATCTPVPSSSHWFPRQSWGTVPSEKEEGSELFPQEKKIRTEAVSLQKLPCSENPQD